MLKPRNVAGPVVRGSDFWGRKGELSHLWDLIGKGSVLLTGPRRHGKSSLMYAVLDSPRPGFEVVLLDVEWVESPEEFLTTMAAELLALDRIRSALRTIKDLPSSFRKWVSGAIEEVGVGAGSVGELKIRLRNEVDAKEAWPDLASAMLTTLRALPNRTVLILDEFPIMIGNMLERDTNSALRFLRWFRTFRQSTGSDELSFLLGGSTNIEPTLEALSSEAVLGDLQRFRLVPFDRTKAKRFVGELLAAEGIPNGEVIAEEIVTVCGTGVPYFLQVLVAECLAEARRVETPLDASHVRYVYDQYVIGPINRQRFSHYHTRLRLHYGQHEVSARLILARLCKGAARTDELRQVLAAEGIPSNQLDRVLLMLEGDYYIEIAGDKVDFADGLIRQWWERNSVFSRRD